MQRLGVWAFKQVHKYPIPWRSCPECDHALDPSSAKMKKAHSAQQAKMQEDGNLSPDEVVEEFTAKLVCTECQSEVFSAGSTYLKPVEEDTNNPYQEWAPTYRVEWLSQYPRLAQTPKDIPWDLARELRRASHLFWSDLSACASVLRSTIEVFLDLQGVSRRTKTRKGDRFLELEQRIDHFVTSEEAKSRARADEYEELLRAAKLIGNTGAHAGNAVSEEDVQLQALFIQRVLDLRYGTPDTIRSKAKQLLDGRPSRRARRKAAGTPPGKGSTVHAATPASMKTGHR